MDKYLRNIFGHREQEPRQDKGGFTLVEMLVSLALFTIVLTIALGALLMVIKANQQAKAIKLVVNNLNLSLEGISRELRVGTNICRDRGLSGNACNTPSSGFSDRIFYTTDQNEPFASYRVNNGRILWCPQDCDTLSDYLPLTGTDVTVEDLRFYVRGSGSGDGMQPMVLVSMNGYTTVNDQRIDLDIQTTVSQRKLEF